MSARGLVVVQSGSDRFAFASMFPKTLALIDDDREYNEFLAQYLREAGIRVDAFFDSNELVAHPDAYAYDFYVVDLMLPGIDGLNLIDLLRRRTNAGVLVVSGRLAADVFKEVVGAGADMYLTKPVQFEQVALAIQAVQRRIVRATQEDHMWTLDRRARQLVTPDGARSDLSEIDMSVLECFVGAGGGAVTRESLCATLAALPGGEAGVDLNATIYRLRRRIERATPTAVPLHAKSRVGYVFDAPLKAL